jgi:hypothetical protein
MRYQAVFLNIKSYIATNPWLLGREPARPCLEWFTHGDPQARPILQTSCLIRSPTGTGLKSRGHVPKMSCSVASVQFPCALQSVRPENPGLLITVSNFQTQYSHLPKPERRAMGRPPKHDLHSIRNTRFVQSDELTYSLTGCGLSKSEQHRYPETD